MLKIIRAIWEVIRTLLTIFLLIFLALILTQRISNNKIAIAGCRIFNVVTESMVPDYKVGDTILTITTDPSQIKVGDDITYLGAEESFKDRIVTHRVISVEKNEDGLYIFQTKGIANDVVDPKINQTQIFGKVVYKLKSISYINGIIGNLYGMYFAIFLPLGILMFIEFVGYRKDKEEQEEKKNQETKSKETKENTAEGKHTLDDKMQKHKEKRKKRREKRRKKKETEAKNA